MEFRVVEEEYEAKLAPVAGQSTAGKVERKRYRDGNEALRAKVRGLDGGATAAALELYIKGARVGSLDDNGKKAELELDSRNGASVPIVASGDTVELHRDGRLLASGTFVED
jgi:hypothetical protein